MKQRLGGWVLLFGLVPFLGSCLKDGDGSQIARAAFAPVQPASGPAAARPAGEVPDVLTEGDVDNVVTAAAMAVDSPNMSICVMDRLGHILRVWTRNTDPRAFSAGLAFDFTQATNADPAEAQVARLNRGAVGIARAAAYLSHSEAALTSRTGQFISTSHFPAQFDTTRFDRTLPGGSVPSRPTVGVRNTPQGPLWQIDQSNRGATLESMHIDPATSNPFLFPHNNAPISPTVYSNDVDEDGNTGDRGDYPPGNVPGGTPSFEGLTALPGGFPLYKEVADPTVDPSFVADPAQIKINRRLVGSVGVYIEDDLGNPLPNVAEFAALNGILAARETPLAGGDITDTFAPLPFGGTGIVPKEGAVFLVGILLPAFEQDTRPDGVGAGTYDPAGTVVPSANFPSNNDPNGDGSFTPDNSDPNNVRDFGAPDPSGYVLTPRASESDVAFTANEVRTIIDACVRASQRTHAAIRSPDFPDDGAQKPITPCQMFISVCDVNGVMLGVFREPDATSFSLEISYTKARNTVFYSRADALDFDGPRGGMHPFAGFLPPGTAITARTLGFLSQPSYPPTIDGRDPGPLFDLAIENRRPVRFDQQGFAVKSIAERDQADPTNTSLVVVPGATSGIIFFPGSAPLYRDGVLIGGIGVSGDGVEQDDLVTIRGIRDAQEILGFNLEPPTEIRCDQFAVRGVAPTYMKFPQHPDG